MNYLFLSLLLGRIEYVWVISICVITVNIEKVKSNRTHLTSMS